MSRRIDIELTSKSSDGSWTWRAAGARQPKGVVAGDLVPDGEAVGGILRADVEIGLEGVEVLSLTSAKPMRSPEKVEGRIEVLGTPKRAPDVSVILAPTSGKRRRRDDDDGDDRRDRKDHRDRKGGTSRRGERAGQGPGVGAGGPSGPGGSGGPSGEGGGPPRGGSGSRRPGARRPGEGDNRP